MDGAAVVQALDVQKDLVDVCLHSLALVLCYHLTKKILLCALDKFKDLSSIDFLGMADLLFKFIMERLAKIFHQAQP